MKKIKTVDVTKQMFISFVKTGWNRNSNRLFILKESSHMYGLPLR